MIEGRPEKTGPESVSDKARKNFEDFLSRSDEPGKFLSVDEKVVLQAKTKASPEAWEEWEKDRSSKYRTNSLSGAIGFAEMFLISNEAESVPEDIKKELLKRIDAATDRVHREKPTGYTKELVDEVVDIVKQTKNYLK